MLLIEKEAFGGQITLSPHVENYPFTRPMSGNELVEVLVEQVMNLGAVLKSVPLLLSAKMRTKQ